MVLFIWLFLFSIGCCENGNALSTRRPLLVVSLDGMRADKFDEFVKENPTSYFSRIINNGIKADYMTPIFPSLTFPNHFTLVTGVYSEEHGIVGNKIYDPSANKMVNFISDRFANEAQWWNRSQPVWLTAKNKGLKVASSFWPGSEVWSRNPDIFIPYSSSFTFTSRIDELVNWFFKFKLDVAFLYFSEPDSAGHTYGPDSQQYKDKIRDMDGVIGYLLNELEKKRLLADMNVIITSDHGMVASRGAPILVQDHVDVNLIDFERSVFSYVSNIYPKDMSQLSQLYESLKSLPNTTVYYKSDVPSQFHYSNSDRIGPIVVILDEGFSLTNDPNYKGIAGIHGFDNRLLSMKTIFLALGPDFKRGEKMSAFDNINVYSLICKLLNLDSSQGKGSANIFEPYFTSGSNQVYRSYTILILAFSIYLFNI